MRSIVATTMAAVFTFALIAAGGCTDHRPSSGGGGPSVDTPKSALPPAGDALIDFRKTGGIAGVSQRVQVWSAGQVRVRDRRGEGTHQLSPERIAELTGLFDNWGKLKADYPAPSGTADAFNYDVAFQGKHVRFSEANKDLPRELRQIVERMTAVAEQALSK